MQMIISPAKKMREDTDSFPCQDLPQLLSYTEKLMERLRGMSFLPGTESFVEMQRPAGRGQPGAAGPHGAAAGPDPGAHSL